MHCHVFSRDHRIQAPLSAFKKFTPGQVFFRTPQEEIKLIETFTNLPSHFTLQYPQLFGFFFIYMLFLFYIFNKFD